MHFCIGASWFGRASSLILYTLILKPGSSWKESFTSFLPHPGPLKATLCSAWAEIGEEVM